MTPHEQYALERQRVAARKARRKARALLPPSRLRRFLRWLGKWLAP